VAIRFEFSENEYFEDAVLEKKFWYRRSRDGWSGLVSEPVRIQWKKDRDLTGGLLDLVHKAWSSQSSSSASGSKTAASPESKALKKKIENTGMGGLSFFAWFGFIGQRISAEESAEATRIEKEKRRERRSGKSSPPAEEESEDEDEEGWGMELEIFPDGDDLAVAITEDLWPGAIKYFSTSSSRPSNERSKED
jgi:hypothetical protein